jgi:Uma2 family endonuclease
MRINMAAATRFRVMLGFLVDLPDRESFSPAAAWYVGEIDDMDFLPGTPAFAVEMRSKTDYGPQADRDVLKKIRDHFAAGTRVVWDVDLLGDEIIKAYRRDNIDFPTIYRRGDTANAEPAVPGWTFAVDTLFARRQR